MFLLAKIINRGKNNEEKRNSPDQSGEVDAGE
jgi:hypothetical protein